MEKDKITLWAKYALAAGLFLILALLLYKLFFDWLLPFTAAFAASALLAPLSRRLSKKTKLPLRVLRLFLLFVAVGGLSLLFILATVYLAREAKDFFINFYNNFDSLTREVFDLIERIKEKLSLSSTSTEQLVDLITGAAQRAMTELSANSAAFAAKIAGKLPSMLFSLLLFLLALFYFSFDYDKVTEYLSSLLPHRLRAKLRRVKEKCFYALGRYLRAYLILFLITFFELLIAFLLLRVEQAALLSLIAAALDILPAVGVGILLLPWAGALLLSGNTGRALILVAIYLAVTLLRQVIEPHIIGAHLGLHPLASLVALYLGFRFLGIFGILASPLLALVATHLLNLYREYLSKKEGTSHDTEQKQQSPP